MVYNFRKPEIAVSAGTASERGVSSLIDSALRVEIIIPQAEFTPGANSPFRVFGAQPAVSVANRDVAPPTPPVQHRRLPLVLKGLMREPPLAILEDERGRTHIKAYGDYIQNAQIIAIRHDSVVLKDSSGTYELTVEANR